MRWRSHGRWRGPRLGLVILGAVLAVTGASLDGLGQAADAQAVPQNDPANQHRITVKFDYDFRKNPSCTDEPTLKTCVKQFVVYDISRQRRRLFSIPVPDGARGFVKGIEGQSPTRIFLPGTHSIAVTAQSADGVESIDAKVKVKVKSKTVHSSLPAK